jgi:hypothetical protein
MKKSTQIILGSVIALLIVSVIASAALSNYRANRIDSILNPKPSASADDGIVTIDKMVVTILNGTNREGLGTRLASRLETFGVFVTKIDNYKKRNIATSELLYKPEALEAATKLAQVAGIQKLTPYPAFEADEFATIITGYDLPEPFPEQIDSSGTQP